MSTLASSVPGYNDTDPTKLRAARTTSPIARTSCRFAKTLDATRSRRPAVHKPEKTASSHPLPMRKRKLAAHSHSQKAASGPHNVAARTPVRCSVAGMKHAAQPTNRRSSQELSSLGRTSTGHPQCRSVGQSKGRVVQGVLLVGTSCYTEPVGPFFCRRLDDGRHDAVVSS